jgi:hypothetical protein
MKIAGCADVVTIEWLHGIFFPGRAPEFSDIFPIASRVSERPAGCQKKWLHGVGPTGRAPCLPATISFLFPLSSEHSSLHVRIGIILSSSMGKLIQCRPLTGCIRRKAKNVTSSYGRVMHLSHAEVGIRDKLHKSIIMTLTAAHLTRRILPYLLLLIQILRNTGLNAQATVLLNFVRLKVLRYLMYSREFRRLFQLDAQWFDIPLDEEANHVSHRLGRQNVGIDSWSAQEAYNNTGFRPDQLRKVYGLFGLEEVANQEPHVGSILVPKGDRNYHFYPEELFMFLLVKCRTGHSNKHLCEHYFGGHASLDLWISLDCAVC